jgi:hypothetical protein
MAQSAPSADKEAAFARYRRRDHANFEALQNLVIAEISRRAYDKYKTENPDDENPPGFEMPTNVRHLISALQGAHGGGKVPYEEFERDYLTIGAQLQFRGNSAAIRSRVRSWVKALDDWQFSVGVELLHIVPGGEFVYGPDGKPLTYPDGAPVRTKTKVIDYLKPKSDEGVQRARFTPLWKENPGRALEAQAGSVVGDLPALGTREESGKEKKPSTPQSVDEYERKQEERIKSTIEKVAYEIELKGGDSALFVRRLAREVMKMAGSLAKTEDARHDLLALQRVEREEDTHAGGSNAYMCKSEGAEPAPAESASEEPLCKEKLTQAAPEVVPIVEVDSFAADETAPEEVESDALPYALNMAAQGIAVFPVYGCTDGICHCAEGSECRSAGKHPIPALTARGVKNATTDERTIRRWFARDPHANLAWAMGGPLHLIGVDVDPRSGGDASLCDLVEAHGDEWLETFTVRTGSLGSHFVFRLPEGVEAHKGKLAPGIDLKSEGGYLVAPPSVHSSGRRYEVEKNVYIAEAPAWLVEELTRAPDVPPSKVVDFQERRDRYASGGSAIVEGERNERLFKVGCALWGKGEVGSRGDLLHELMRVNVERVSPPLPSDEVYKIVDSISSRYPLGVPIKEGAG